MLKFLAADGNTGFSEVAGLWPVSFLSRELLNPLASLSFAGALNVSPLALLLQPLCFAGASCPLLSASLI